MSNHAYPPHRPTKSVRKEAALNNELAPKSKLGHAFRLPQTIKSRMVTTGTAATRGQLFARDRTRWGRPPRRGRHAGREDVALMTPNRAVVLDRLAEWWCNGWDVDPTLQPGHHEVVLSITARRLPFTPRVHRPINPIGPVRELRGNTGRYLVLRDPLFADEVNALVRSHRERRRSASGFGDQHRGR